jgi:DNA-binding MarR family transcriptional regulator
MYQTKLNLKEEIELHNNFNKTNSVRIIRQITRHINTEINYYLIQKGHSKLSARHLSVFENLDFDGTNIVTLAHRAGMTKQAMSKLVKEVIQEGYARAIIDERDSRALTVYFTDKGVCFLKDMRETIQEVRAAFKAKGFNSSSNNDSFINNLQNILRFFETSSAN